MSHTSFPSKPFPSSPQDGAGIKGKNTFGKEGKGHERSLSSSFPNSEPSRGIKTQVTAELTFLEMDKWVCMG